MSYVRSPFHPHILSIRSWSRHFLTYPRKDQSKQTEYFRCKFCWENTDGSTSIYCCEKCGFYVHPSCVTLPPPRFQHPGHEHPLDLQRSFEGFRYHDYRCVEADCGWECSMEAPSALNNLRVEKYYRSMLREAGDGESRLQFAHEHPLTSFPVRTRTVCAGCGSLIEEEAYGCSECNFFLHESCAKPPLEIQHHPFHPEHPLYLFTDFSYVRCSACASACVFPVAGYRCEECKLIFGLCCAISTMPCEADDDDDEREDIRRLPSVIDHPLHPHQLSSYHSKGPTWPDCRICYDRIGSGDFFGCIDCGFFLHESCAQPPKEIKHYLHPEHALTFSRCPDEKEHGCASCGSPVKSASYCYTCQMCGLFIHQKCASATLSDLEKGVGTTVQYSFHEHELKLYYSNNKYDEACAVCEGTVLSNSLAYKCFSQGCSFNLHKSCWQLASDLVHPAHSLHPLTLGFKPPSTDIACRRCFERIGGLFAFSCGECNFHLHVDCAQIPTVLKHPLHEHQLFYFDMKDKMDLILTPMPNFECRACRKTCNVDLFRCAQCDFTLHSECSQLQPTIKSEHHWDPLVLRDSIDEDHSSRECYCDICERRRDPNKWVYFCETCNYNFVAHIECALSPVKLEVIEEHNFVEREIKIELVQEKVDAKEAALKPQMVELESLRAELEELQTEHAKWIGM